MRATADGRLSLDQTEEEFRAEVEKLGSDIKKAWFCYFEINH